MPALPLALGRFRGDRSPPTLQDRLGTRPSQGGDSCGLPIEGLREAQDLSLWGEESRESGGLPDSEERRDDTGLSAAAAKPVPSWLTRCRTNPQPRCLAGLAEPDRPDRNDAGVARPDNSRRPSASAACTTATAASLSSASAAICASVWTLSSKASPSPLALRSRKSMSPESTLERRRPSPGIGEGALLPERLLASQSRESSFERRLRSIPHPRCLLGLDLSYNKINLANSEIFFEGFMQNRTLKLLE